MIQFHYSNGGTEIFTRVNAGLAWPTIEAPAYFCIFAQKEKENPSGKRPLVQVFELEDVEGSIDSFFKKVKGIAERYKVYLIYTDVEDSAFFEKFSSNYYYLLQKTTGAQDFLYGLEVIKAWSKLGGIETMEDSILRSQLSSLRETELKEAPGKFNGVNALRYCVGGFDDWWEGRFDPGIELEKVWA